MTPDSATASGGISIQGSQAARDIIAANNLTVNQTIVQQLLQTKTKRWRQLTDGLWSGSPEPSTNELYAAQVCEALRVAFGETYEDFVAHFTFNEVQVRGQTIWIYKLLCHKAAFCSILESARRDHLKKLQAVDLSSDPVAARKAFRRELLAKPNLLESWHITQDFRIGAGLHIALRMIYDPASKRISLQEAEPQSADPGAYPDHLTRTSELLTLVAYVASARHVFGGNVKWWSTKEYRLQKLLVYFLDAQTFEMSRIRVNVEDDEDWDFVNPEYDDEVLEHSK